MTSLATIPVGALVPAAPFACTAKHHHFIDEVRLDEIREVIDRRFRDGVRRIRCWSGYCACCGRRVRVEPDPD